MLHLEVVLFLEDGGDLHHGLSASPFWEHVVIAVHDWKPVIVGRTFDDPLETGGVELNIEEGLAAGLNLGR